ncbi:hypothetical protein JZ751_009852 [Albula glossodonta]|uniref:Sodium channel modifier 1 n=1 Tax=Albula glossodonta TaxID=121402 RepID=A0A8T2P0N3_9TELE|nr:hypothetical protein JZ751_009852 [Albula glossodonta]
MSFKREGDDSSQLNILKKRRVADLLSNFIPEDEAALMKNGRYTCLVCSYRPVFDTVDMLTVHRKGKRHLEDHQRQQPAEKKQEAVRKKSLDPEPISAQRRRELEYYLKLKSAGWLQDKNGSWVKDENVEFDSDEDQPVPLPPPPHITESPDIQRQERH